MKNKVLACLCFILLYVIHPTYGEIVATVTYNGKPYFLDVQNKSSENNVRVEIWFRENRNASSIGDLKITELKANTDDMKHFIDLSCRAKKDFDENKGLLGCLATVGSVFCAAGTAATEGALAFVCETTWTYAIDKGAADCLKLASESVAKFSSKEKEWKSLALIAQIPDVELSEAISSAIDYMCEDVVQKKD
ncbi:hypothetical protein [Segetibacter koreensis]|uniref:hypothetical protein n=1 Tax=Segetibacter koreensis TaxID=398037 RepID=UPI00036E7C1E|nr:hypothetical protein [Segetibacter koreensis]